MKTSTSVIAIRGEIPWKTVSLHSARTAVAAIASLLIARRCCFIGNLLGADNDSGGYAVVNPANSLDFRGTLHWHRTWCYRRGLSLQAAMDLAFIMFGISVFILGLLTSAPHLGRSAYRFAAITLAIVMLVPSTDSPRQIARHRFVEVCIGIGVALVLTVF
jgi:hypothetical protein